MPSKKPRKQQSSIPPSTPETRSVQEILRQTREVLETARRGLRDIQSDDPTDHIPGIQNVAAFGRSVTYGLQRLKNVAPSFEEWYRAKGLEKDPLLIFFNQLRNTILKEVNLDVDATTYIQSYMTGTPILQGSPPPGTTGTFVGEARTGGSGWIVQLPDGREEKYYAALSPEFRGRVTLHLPNPPREHAGTPITDTSVENLAELYVTFLDELVSEAEARFMPPSGAAPE